MDPGVMVEGQYEDGPSVRLAIPGGLMTEPAVYHNQGLRSLCGFATITSTPPCIQLDSVLFGTGSIGCALVLNTLERSNRYAKLAGVLNITNTEGKRTSVLEPSRYPLGLIYHFAGHSTWTTLALLLHLCEIQLDKL